ncbi:MAG: mucin desulfatase, partial [Oscillospiraceae bacterium]|nr:mucin desulfatase [Oscillospiraceae bacterium]
ASTAAEDEQDLSKVRLSLTLFRAYTEGFLSQCGSRLTDKEIETLPLGAKLMTLECGSRFLADYLNGDKYFHVKYPDHNLIRCRTQLKLAEDMERKWTEMQEIVRLCAAACARR